MTAKKMPARRTQPANADAAVGVGMLAAVDAALARVPPTVAAAEEPAPEAATEKKPAAKKAHHMGARENKVPIQFRLYPDLVVRLNAAAHKRGGQRTALVEQILADWLDEHGF